MVALRRECTALLTCADNNSIWIDGQAAETLGEGPAGRGH